MKYLLKVVILLISLASTYIFYLNNISSEIQKEIYQDIFSGNYRESSTARFQVLNLEMPNLSLSSLPMKGLIARYYYLGAQFDKALELANESMHVNPYIMYNESLKQDIFFELGVKDSLIYYAEKTFSGIPNNKKHFIDLARAYSATNKRSKIDSIFKLVEHTNTIDIWKFYFSAILGNEDSISPYGKEKAKEALEKFSSSGDTQLRLSANYVLYGKNNVDKALDIDKEAENLYANGQFIEAAEKYQEAIKLNPNEYSFYENAGISYHLFGYYDKAIPLLNKVIDSLNPLTGKSEFVIAQSYFNLNDFEKACQFIKLSSKLNYRDSFRLISEYCK